MIDGTWTVTIATPMGSQVAALDLTSAGDRVSGVGRAMGSTMHVTDGVLDGGHLTFRMRVSRPMPMTLAFDVVVTGDSLAGEVKAGAFGRQKVTGSRTG